MGMYHKNHLDRTKIKEICKKTDIKRYEKSCEEKLH